MADNKVQIPVEVLVQDAIKNLNQLNKTVSDSNKGFSGFQKSIITINQGLQLFKQVMNPVVDLFGDAIQAAIEQENAINELETALKGAGVTSKIASQNIQAFASELQKTTTFGDEATISASALYIQLTKDAKGYKEATVAAQNLSAALNIDLNSAVRLIAQSLEDGGSGLKRYNVSVKEGKTPAEDLANAIAGVNEKFGGVASSKINTYAGAIQQAKNSWGDLLENLGNAVIKSPLVINSIQLITKALLALNERLATPEQKAAGKSIEYLQEAYSNFGFEIDQLQKKLAGIQINAYTANTVAQIRQQIKELQEEQKAYADQIVLIEEEKNQKQVDSNKNKFSIIKDLDLAYAEFQKEQKDRENLEAQTKDIERLDMIREYLGEQALIDAEFKALELERAGQHEQAVAALRDAYRAAEQKKIEQDRLWQQGQITQLMIFEKLVGKEKAKNVQDSLNTISTLQTAHNSTLKTIGKASALGMATLDGYVAINKAWATPWPLNLALVPLVTTAVLANIAKISGYNFADGGIVPGTSFIGDNVSANVNSGEMILNREQQSRLFEIANAGGTASTNINVYVSGDVVSEDNFIDRVVNGINDGIRLRNLRLEAA